MSRRGRPSAASLRLRRQAPLKAVQARQEPRSAPRPRVALPAAPIEDTRALATNITACLGCGERFITKTLTECVCRLACWPLAVFKFFPEGEHKGET